MEVFILKIVMGEIAQFPGTPFGLQVLSVRRLCFMSTPLSVGTSSFVTRCVRIKPYIFSNSRSRLVCARLTGISE
jgi:hypothetical protein